MKLTISWVHRRSPNGKGRAANPAEAIRSPRRRTRFQRGNPLALQQLNPRRSRSIPGFGPRGCRANLCLTLCRHAIGGTSDAYAIGLRPGIFQRPPLAAASVRWSRAGIMMTSYVQTANAGFTARFRNDLQAARYFSARWEEPAPLHDRRAHSAGGRFGRLCFAGLVGLRHLCSDPGHERRRRPNGTAGRPDAGRRRADAQSGPPARRFARAPPGFPCRRCFRATPTPTGWRR